jgi:hypothetical protein
MQQHCFTPFATHPLCLLLPPLLPLLLLLLPPLLPLLLLLPPLLLLAGTCRFCSCQLSVPGRTPCC